VENNEKKKTFPVAGNTTLFNFNNTTNKQNMICLPYEEQKRTISGDSYWFISSTEKRSRHCKGKIEGSTI